MTWQKDGQKLDLLYYTKLFFETLPFSMVSIANTRSCESLLQITFADLIIFLNRPTVCPRHSALDITPIPITFLTYIFTHSALRHI